MRPSMSSRAPVSSPTEIICTTICGKTVDWRSGAEIVSPSRMLARAAMIASWITRLPEVRGGNGGDEKEGQEGRAQPPPEMDEAGKPLGPFIFPFRGSAFLVGGRGGWEVFAENPPRLARLDHVHEELVEDLAVLLLAQR